jgi:hypothetical protein
MMERNMEIHEQAADKEVYDLVYRNRASKLGPVNIDDLKRQMAEVN